MPDDRVSVYRERVARLRVAICDCPNPHGRHACDLAAEQVALAIDDVRASRPGHESRWARIVRAVAKELKNVD